MFDYKNATKKQLIDEFDRLRKITKDHGFLTKKEFFHLPEILMPEEDVIAISSGSLSSNQYNYTNSWLIVLTNSRIILLDKGLIYGVKQISIDLEKITSVGASTGIIFGNITITTSLSEFMITYVLKKSVVIFTNLVKQTIKSIAADSAQKQMPPASEENSLISQLERLANLKEKGILSEEEFNAQKAKLLNS